MNDKISEMEQRIENEERTCQQLLGSFIVGVAILNMAEIVIKLIIRFLYKGDTLRINTYEVFLGEIRLALVIVLFVIALTRMKRLFFHSPDTRKLLVLWGVILIPIQLINDVCVMLYTRMLELLQAVLLNSGIDSGGQIFAMIYDSTHGFKYICIFSAILLGIVMTAEILEKRKMIIVGVIFALMFMIAFTIFRMQTVTIDSLVTFEIGINWTSMIFHMLTTVGLFLIGLYIILTFKKDKSTTEEK